MTELVQDSLKGEVVLRDVQPDDIPIFFEHQLDPEVNWMAAFTAEDPHDRDAFMAHWNRILDEDALTKQTVLLNGLVAGHILKFDQFGKPSVSYWIGKEYWGRGVATRALALFLKQVETRPLYARAAKDNVGSIRVLEKCGFPISGEDSGFASARGGEVAEFILELRGGSN